MKKETMLRLIPELCKLAEDPAIRASLALGDSMEAEEMFWSAAENHPEAMYTRHYGLDTEEMALLRLCTQCGAGEMMAAAAGCAVSLTPEGLAVLVSEGRRREAMLRYGLQLLWRLCGDEAIPDALATFPEPGPPRRAEDVISALEARLKGGGGDA